MDAILKGRTIENQKADVKGEEPGEDKMEVEEEQEDAKAAATKIAARVGGGQDKTGLTLKLTGIKTETQSSGLGKRKEPAAATQAAAKKLKTKAPAAAQGENAAAGAGAAKALKVPTEAEVMAADLLPPPPPPPRTKWTRRVPHPVLIGHDCSGDGWTKRPWRRSIHSLGGLSTLTLAILRCATADSRGGGGR
jgi:hypothetical protein